MKIKEYKIKELINGRYELENEKIKNYKYFFIFFLMLILFVFIFIYFSEIELNVKAVGVIENNSNISIIRSINSGKVLNNYMKDGLKIEKGQTLLELDDELSILKYKKLEKEIKANRELLNYLLGDENQINNLILDYKLELEKLNIKINQNRLERAERERELKNSKELYFIGGISKKELINLENEYSKILLNEKMISTEIKKFKLVKIKNILNIIDNLEIELEQLKLNLKNNKIVSAIKGELEIEKYVNSGDYISNEILGRIIPTEGRYNVKLYIDLEEINKVKVGSKVVYFLKNEKGEEYNLKGEINYISNTTILLNDKLYYYANCSIENKNNIKIGQMINSHIFYSKKTIFNYLIEILKK